jgi:hypothetical protein
MLGLKGFEREGVSNSVYQDGPGVLCFTG